MPQAKEPIIIGLTGSIGSGKSEVARIFEELGALVIDADLLAREAVLPGSPALAAIVKEFGAQVLEHSGSLNRKLLGAIVFSDRTKLKVLETIVHPEVRRLFLAKLATIKDGSGKLIVYVVPLLFESTNIYPELSKKITVSAPRNVCIERVQKRDSSSKEMAERKFDSQMPPESKEQLSDFVIRNDGSLEQLRDKVLAVFNLLVT